MQLVQVLKTKIGYLTDRSLIQDCYKITSLSPFSAKTNGRTVLLKFTMRNIATNETVFKEAVSLKLSILQN